jgi:hypothetical protein
MTATAAAAAANNNNLRRHLNQNPVTKTALGSASLLSPTPAAN